MNLTLQVTQVQPGFEEVNKQGTQRPVYHIMFSTTLSPSDAAEVFKEVNKNQECVVTLIKGE